MNAGVLADGFVNWYGGIDFLRSMIDSLLTARSRDEARVHLLISDRGPRLAWRRIRKAVKLKSKSLFGAPPPIAEPTIPSALVSEAFAGFGDKIRIHHIDIGRPALVRTTQRLRLDVIIPTFQPLGRDFPTPWVGYTYDFQHKYLPEFFRPDERAGRDQGFLNMLTEASAVIVNSRSATGDIAKFVPQATARVFTLPFSPSPDPEWRKDDPSVLARYRIQRPFFLVSNQFWLHKDHTTAFEAFRIVAGRSPEVGLVCTGGTADPRDPGYFSSLTQLLARHGLQDRVHILGLIPKRDQIEILKNTNAVLQPTRFEGGPGGGSVYDAVSLGVPAIVSNLPVNMEITDREVEFFPVGDAEALAKCMMKKLEMQPSRPPWADLAVLGHQRRQACGNALWEAAAVAVSSRVRAPAR